MSERKHLLIGTNAVLLSLTINKDLFVGLIKENQIDHLAVQDCLKTMKNWQEEICNSHRIRFTNAAVEGNNKKIEPLQRRYYFTRNPKHYKQRIILECNEELIGN